jgi:RNA-directed DNA polymerase
VGIACGASSGGPIVNDRYQVIGIAQRGGNAEHKQLAVEMSEILKLATEPTSK